MKTLSERNEWVRAELEAAKVLMSLTGVACDACGTEMLHDRRVMERSCGGNPVTCPKCGNRGVLV